MGSRNRCITLRLPLAGCCDCSSYNDVSAKMEISIVWMLLNGWFAKHCFEDGSTASGWVCLCISAYYLARVMESIF